MKYDIYLPVGEDCTPAYYLKECGLRKEAYPLDWMVFDDRTFIHLFKTGFSDFFTAVTEEAPVSENTCRCIRDVKNNILSMHHFPLDRDADEFKTAFLGMMQKRYDRLHKRLLSGKSVLLVGYRQTTKDEASELLYGFSDIYPHLHIQLLNVINEPAMNSSDLRRDKIYLTDKLSIAFLYFNCDYDTVKKKNSDFGETKGSGRKY